MTRTRYWWPTATTEAPEHDGFSGPFTRELSLRHVTRRLAQYGTTSTAGGEPVFISVPRISLIDGRL